MALDNEASAPFAYSRTEANYKLKKGKMAYSKLISLFVGFEHAGAFVSSPDFGHRNVNLLY